MYNPMVLQVQLGIRAARLGDAQGLFTLCRLSESPELTGEAWTKNRKIWCSLAAEKHYPGAAQYLSDQYKTDFFGQINASKSLHWAERAIHDQDVLAEREALAVRFNALWGEPWIREGAAPPVKRKRESYVNAVQELTALADAGNVEAMLFLANKYRHGYGVKRDKEAFLKLTERAAELGDGRAAVDLAGWLSDNSNGHRNRKKVLHWFKRGLELGYGAYDPMHRNPIDFIEHLEAEEKRKLENALSDEGILKMVRGVGMQGIARDNEIMCAALISIDYRGDKKLRYNCEHLPLLPDPVSSLGYGQRNLDVVRKFSVISFYDDDVSWKWQNSVREAMISKATEPGSLSYFYRLRSGCKGLYSRCHLKWGRRRIDNAQLRADSGDRRAMIELHSLYAIDAHLQNNGKYSVAIVNQNSLDESTEWLSRAIKRYQADAALGDPVAQFQMGVFYEKGLGLTVNKEVSRYWFKEFIGAPSVARALYFNVPRGDSEIFNGVRKACLTDRHGIDDAQRTKMSLEDLAVIDCQSHP
ncbi:MAG: SEL1-like repeat protein [Robiginitomaculum sp.]